MNSDVVQERLALCRAEREQQQAALDEAIARNHALRRRVADLEMFTLGVVLQWLPKARVASPDRQPALDGLLRELEDDAREALR